MEKRKTYLNHVAPMVLRRQTQQRKDRIQDTIKPSVKGERRGSYTGSLNRGHTCRVGVQGEKIATHS